jgi:hypothetical protein
MVNREAIPVNCGCPKGEAVFYEQMPDVMGGLSGFQEIVGEVQRYIQHIADLKDDRLYALVADLLAENAIDNYLLELMPKYKKELADNKDFTFSLKIAVAKELRLSPAKFFKGADVLRKIRNEFAHNLEIKNFEDLNSKFINEIDSVLETYFTKIRPTHKSIRDKFASLLINTIIELSFQTRYIRSLNSYLRDDAFCNNLTDYCRKKQKT